MRKSQRTLFPPRSNLRGSPAIAVPRSPIFPASLYRHLAPLPSLPRTRESIVPPAPTPPPVIPQLPSPKSEKPGTADWMPAFAGMTGMVTFPLSPLPRCLRRLAPFTVASLLYRHSRERGSPSHGKHPHPANCHPPPNRLKPPDITPHSKATNVIKPGYPSLKTKRQNRDDHRRGSGGADGG